MHFPVRPPRMIPSILALAALATLGSPPPAAAQSGWAFQDIHVFTGTGADGRSPSAGLIVGTGGTLYGTTEYGGTVGFGSVFKINQNGTGFQTLASCSPITGAAIPLDSLVQGTNGSLYGTTVDGGVPQGIGALFSLNSDGSNYQTIHSFNEGDGRNPQGSLIFGPGGALYGTTAFNGGGNGNIFRVNTDGSGFQTLYSFPVAAVGAGSNPYAGLTLGPGNVLYGTTAYGGAHGAGTVFSLNADGTDFKTLYSFDQSDGEKPLAGLTFGPDGTLYGTTSEGGSANDGTVFRINTDGNGFENLFSFSPATGSGASPTAGVIFGPDGNLYGTTANTNGISGGDTVFELAPNGTGYQTLHVFDGVDGLSPVGSLVFGTGDTLYGTAQKGGADGDGVIFALSATPEPSQDAVLALGVLGLGTLLLRARKGSSDAD